MKLGSKILLLSLSPFLPAVPDLIASPASEAAAHHHDFQGEAEGIVVGRFAEGTTSFGEAGRLRAAGPAVDSDTLFEIGSITKVFTGILLADAVLKGKATLDDPVSKHLPADLLPAGSPLHGITLLDLATHTSGLPRLPSNIEKGADPKDPYAHYSVARLHDCLREIGESDLQKRGETSYSNLGMGLLGYLLERISEKPYEALVRETLFEPLGMGSSFVQRRPGDIPSSETDRFATGHSGGKETPHWHIDALCGAGAIVSSAKDLMAFAAAHLSPETPGTLREAMALAATPQRGAVGLGWFVGKEGLQHDGGTGGFRSELRISLADKTAAARLMNGTGSSAPSESRGDFTALTGYWQGVLDTGAAKLRLVLRIAQDGRVVLHSLDQGAVGMPAHQAIHEEGTFRAVFSAIGGSFEGRIDGGTLSGTWKQGGSLPLELTRQETMPEPMREALSKRASGDLSPLHGYWSGFLGGKAGLFVVLEIEAFDGSGEARLYSPDQTPEAMPVTKLSFDGSQLTLSLDSIQAAYAAELDSDGKLSGGWKQGLLPLPLSLTKSPTMPKREETNGGPDKERRTP